MTALDRVDDHAVWKPAESAGEPDRRGDSEPVRRAVSTRLQAGVAVEILGSEAVNGSGRAGASARVDDHAVIESRPRLHEGGCFTRTNGRLEVRAIVSSSPPPDDGDSGAVVPRVGVRGPWGIVPAGPGVTARLERRTESGRRKGATG
jgi:hypothetical protein